MKVVLDRLARERTTLCGPVAHSIALAGKRGRRQWLAVRFSIPPRDILQDFVCSRNSAAFYWQQPSCEVSILGLGRLATIEGRGPDRFHEASLAARDLFANLELFDLEDANFTNGSGDRTPQRGPLLLGGFAFSDRGVDDGSEWRTLGAGRLVLPEVGVVIRQGEAWLTRSCFIDPGDRIEEVLDRVCKVGREYASQTPAEAEISLPQIRGDFEFVDEREEAGLEIRVQTDRPHSRYLAQVEAARDAIDAGKFEKVVLARSLRVRADHDFDLASFLSVLRETYPSCTTLAVRERDCWFISATPEKLVALARQRVTTAAVAGSAPRGRSQAEETLHSSRLLESDKERAEHEVVERSIRSALSETCGWLEGPASPGLLKLEGIQHLETPLHGSLLSKWRGRLGVLDLVAALHPTPAVGGAPRSPALDWLDQHEELDRGWYAGPVGHVDAHGDGEFRVALRSGLLRARCARLFAGAGIVSSSEPKRELAETRLKLRALLAPLTEI
ncbi:MAG: isochorismate synthase [Proteobacteria bacterium]|nr:isochorismate synthase [Pseudomonadota bacterium]